MTRYDIPNITYILYKYSPFAFQQKIMLNLQVSETDMYLLGAIEKLVHRMDSMEKRLRRSEELIQHIVEGNAANREGQSQLLIIKLLRHQKKMWTTTVRYYSKSIDIGIGYYLFLYRYLNSYKKVRDLRSLVNLHKSIYVLISS